MTSIQEGSELPTVSLSDPLGDTYDPRSCLLAASFECPNCFSETPAQHSGTDPKHGSTIQETRGISSHIPRETNQHFGIIHTN